MNPDILLEMSDSPPRRSFLLVCHRFSWKLIEALDGFVRGLWAGVWLGLLKREHFHGLDQRYYGISKSYPGAQHNLSGLFSWEAQAVDHYFRECRRVVLLGAGAGREVAPLLDRGLEVVAHECHEGLRQAGNDLLEHHEPSCSIQPMERDRCPELDGSHDGVIVGWGMYTLIQGRERRIQLLKDLRASTPGNAPMLLSFYVLGGPRRPYRIAAGLGAALRRILRREDIEYGDYLSPDYAHFFTRENLEEELEASGWRLDFFDRRTYPHAVAIADTRTE